MQENSISITDICSLAIYELINVLFVYKYVSRITSQPVVICLFYLIAVTLFILLLFRKTEFGISLKTQNIIYFSMTVLLAILLTWLMFQFDPQNIRVGRYPAMYEWITRFFSSEFPYASPTRPSGFPFLFGMGMPFYFLGDLGFLQIFSFLCFAILVHLRHGQKSINRFRLIFLLITAPLFLYEVVVRSDLISNMVMVMLYLAIFEAFSQKASGIALGLLGIMGGFLLSTRGIVLLIYVPFFGYFFRRSLRNPGLFFLSMLAGFFLSLFPFLIWDWRGFINFGPFSRQLSQIPIFWVFLSIAGSIFCAISIRSLKRIYSFVSFILFSVVGVAFIITAFDCGWFATVLKDEFDISYFCFALPFLLISLDLPERVTMSPNTLLFTSERI